MTYTPETPTVCFGPAEDEASVILERVCPACRRFVAVGPEATAIIKADGYQRTRKVFCKRCGEVSLNFICWRCDVED